MELPNGLKESAFRSMLKQGFIFRLRGDKPFESDVYHVFVVLNYDFDNGEVLLLVNGTSRVEKRIEYLNKVGIDVDATTVVFEAGSYSFITKRTIFDCNSVKSININDIPFGNEIRFIGDQLSSDDIEKLIRAALASENVLESHKKIINPKQD